MVDPQLLSQANTSIIIPSAGHALPGDEIPMVDRCLATLAWLDPPPSEVIVVVGDEYKGEPPRQLNHLPMRVIHRGPGSFDFSRAVNCGILASSSELVLILNDDIEAESGDWLGRMGAHLGDPTVGAVGAALMYPDRSIQHIGIEFDGAQPVHSFRGCEMSEAVEAEGDAAREVVSVTGACLLARRNDLLAIGGLSLEFPASYGDIDLCLRLFRSGLRTVVEPSATLVHHESSSRPPVIEPWECERFVKRWGEAPESSRHPINSQNGHHYDSPMPEDLLDGEDYESLRHEILSLRDRTLGAEVSSQSLADRVANKEDRIAELEEQVRERETLIEEWKDRVAERDTRISEREARIAERDTRIAERDTRIAEWDTRIAEWDARISERDARIANLEAENLRLHEELAKSAFIRLTRRIARRIARGPNRDE